MYKPPKQIQLKPPIYVKPRVNHKTFFGFIFILGLTKKKKKPEIEGLAN